MCPGHQNKVGLVTVMAIESYTTKEMAPSRSISPPLTRSNRRYVMNMGVLWIHKNGGA